MGKEVSTAEDTIRTIKRKTRRQYSPEEKMRIVMEGMRGEESIAALCRRGAHHRGRALLSYTGGIA